MKNHASGKAQGSFRTVKNYVRIERRGYGRRQWKIRMGKLWIAGLNHSEMRKEWALE